MYYIWMLNYEEKLGSGMEYASGLAKVMYAKVMYAKVMYAQT